MKYKLLRISSENLKSALVKIENLVETCLAQGWQLQGGPSVIYDVGLKGAGYSHPPYTIVQAIAKPEPNPVSTDSRLMCLINFLDANICRDMKPTEALERAVEAYAYVFHYKKSKEKAP